MGNYQREMTSIIQLVGNDRKKEQHSIPFPTPNFLVTAQLVRVYGWMA